MWRACLLRAWLLLGPAFSPTVFPAPLNVTVVVSDDSAPYMELAGGIASGLERNGAGRSHTIGLGALARLEHDNADVIVTVGSKATQAVAAMGLRVPVLSTLIPKAGFEEIARKRKDKPDPRYFSAVYIDQPIARQLDLIRAALPEKKQVGVVLGPESERLLETLQTETRSRGLGLHAVRIGAASELFSALQNVLSEADVLLSLPDPLVYNPQTIQSVLFTTYRYQGPVIGLSPAYVRAGALAAVYSTPVQLARQVSEILSRLSADAPLLPAPQYPVYFSVSVNHRVAHSLDLVLDKEETLAAKLGAPGPKP